MKRIYTVLLAALLALSLFSCKKELPEALDATESERIAEARMALRTPEEVNFFEFSHASLANPNLLPPVEIQFRDAEDDAIRLTVLNQILLQNQTGQFVHKVIQAFGYPIWDRSVVEFESTNQRKAVFIPFAKVNEHHIRAFLLAFPLDNEWFFMLADKQNLLSMLANPGIDNEVKEFFTIVYLNFDQYLFGETDEVLADWLTLNGDNNGFTSDEDELQPRCTYWLMFAGTCIRPHVFQSGDDEIESRWPCPPGTAPVGVFTVEEGSDCGTTNGVPFPSGSGGGGGGWTGSAPSTGTTGSSGGGSGSCAGCGNNNWGDPIISAQMQQCDLIANIMTGQVAGSLGQFSQAEIDLCAGLNAIVGTLLVDGADLSFLVNHPEILTSLQAFIESGNATPSDITGINRFLSLWKEGKISMAWREFLALHRLVFGELVPELGLSVQEGEWLLGKSEIAQELDAFLDQIEILQDPEELIAARQSALSVIKLQRAGLFYGPYDGNFEAVLLDIAPDLENYNPYWLYLFSIRIAELKIENQEWCNANPVKCEAWVWATAFKDVLLDQIHIGLDLIGLIPGAEIADVTNGVIYTLQGEGISATLSFAAAIPLISGWAATGTKWARKTLGRFKLTYTVGSDGLIWFGNADSLRKQMRRLLKTPTGEQAHHILPLQFWDRPLVQKAASATGDDAFHMNELFNGISLPTSRHNGAHSIYSGRIEERLIQWHSDFPNATPAQAAQKLREWLVGLKNTIETSTLHINDIIPPVIPPL